MLANVHRELFEAWCQLDTMAYESIEAYKNLEECTDTKREYASAYYIFHRDEVHVKVLLKYLTLRLDFLDERSSDEGDVEALEVPMNYSNDLPLTV